MVISKLSPRKGTTLMHVQLTRQELIKLLDSLQVPGGGIPLVDISHNGKTAWVITAESDGSALVRGK